MAKGKGLKEDFDEYVREYFTRNKGVIEKIVIDRKTTFVDKAIGVRDAYVNNLNGEELYTLPEMTNHIDQVVGKVLDAVGEEFMYEGCPNKLEIKTPLLSEIYYDKINT